jgi:hypothetical protein
MNATVFGMACALIPSNVALAYGWGDTTRLPGVLGFDSGQYGRARPQELAQLQTGADAEEIRRLAKQLLSQSGRLEAPHVPDTAAMITKLRIFPVGWNLDRDLTDQLLADLRKPGQHTLVGESSA